MSAPIPPRRGFLRGLATLPLIGGGVTLIGRPAASAITLIDVAAAPLADPRERARYAWEAFAAAMRDLTPDANGWFVQGGEQTAKVGYMPAISPWCQPVAVHCDLMFPDRPGHPGLVDRHEEIAL